MELFKKKKTGQQCLGILYSEEQRNKVFRARMPDNSQDLLQCVRFSFFCFFCFFFFAPCLSTMHSEHTIGIPQQSYPFRRFIRFQSALRNPISQRTAGGKENLVSFQWKWMRYRTLEQRPRSIFQHPVSLPWQLLQVWGGQSRSSLHTQAHSSWCSRATSVRDFCRPLPPLRYFSSSTCREGRRVDYFS